MNVMVVAGDIWRTGTRHPRYSILRLMVINSLSVLSPEDTGMLIPSRWDTAVGSRNPGCGLEASVPWCSKNIIFGFLGFLLSWF